MNIGIRTANGEVIARVDGHTRLASDYIRTGVETLLRTGADNVGGPITPVGGGRFGDCVAAAMSSRFGIGAYFHFGREEREADTVYLGMWPRSVFERVGLFDEEMVRNQDDEFNYRLRRAGGRVVFNPRMRSWYENRQSPRRLARQFFEYGVWKVRVLQKHPGQMSWRHFVAPAFVSTLMLSVLAAAWCPSIAAFPAALAGVYASALFAAGVVGARDASVASVAGTMAAFAVIHLSWGFGFLAGLWRFRGRFGCKESAPPTLVRIEKPG
jgi:hypothetical protein